MTHVNCNELECRQTLISYSMARLYAIIYKGKKEIWFRGILGILKGLLHGHQFVNIMYILIIASSGACLIIVSNGRSLVVANAGDCRAVLCRRGKAIEMSRDHKPVCSKEKKRIEACGGYVYDGYLNGQLNVARALGDWHMEGLKDVDGGPLSAEPEFMTTRLTEEDEFLIIGCDGIWDVFRSQNAVDFARRRLQEHNDPALCSKDLVDEALKRKSGDNLAAVVVCFQPQAPPNLVAPRPRVQRSISAEGLRELQSFLDGLGKD